MTKVLHFRYFFYPFLALLFGLNIARSLYLADVTSLVCTVLIFCAVATGMLLFGKWKPLVLLVAFFFVGNGVYFLCEHFAGGKVYEGESVVVARVTDTSSEYYNTSRIVLDDVKINGESAKNICLSINATQESLPVGSIIAFSASLQNTDFITTNFNNFYLRNNIAYSATCKLADVTVVDSSVKWDESIRLAVKARLYENMSADNAALSYAVLFGNKSDIDYSTKQTFRNAGVIHLLTVSGLHVGFLIALVCFLLSLIHIKRIWTTLISAIFLILFNILCGFAPAVFRASVMALVIMFAKLSARRYDRLNSLGLAGFIILAFNPLYALDVGFLMSFGCVGTIFLLFEPLKNLLSRFMHLRIAEAFALSISAEIGILPFMATIMSNFNFLSFFANLLIVPLFSVIYPFLFIVAFLSAGIGFAGKLLVLADFGLVAVKALASFFASTSVIVGLRPFALPISILIYTLIFMFSHFVMLQKRQRWIGGALLSLTLAVTIIFATVPL